MPQRYAKMTESGDVMTLDSPVSPGVVAWAEEFVVLAHPKSANA